MSSRMVYHADSEGRAKKLRHLIQVKTSSRAVVDRERVTVFVIAKDRRMVTSICHAVGAMLVEAEKNAVNDGKSCLDDTSFREMAIQRAAYGEAFKPKEEPKPPELDKGRGGLPAKAFSKW